MMIFTLILLSHFLLNCFRETRDPPLSLFGRSLVAGCGRLHYSHTAAKEREPAAKSTHSADSRRKRSSHDSGTSLASGCVPEREHVHEALSGRSVDHRGIERVVPSNSLPHHRNRTNSDPGSRPGVSCLGCRDTRGGGGAN